MCQTQGVPVKREDVFEFIAKNPDATCRDVMAILDATERQVRPHLKALHRGGYIRVAKRIKTMIGKQSWWLNHYVINENPPVIIEGEKVYTDWRSDWRPKSDPALMALAGL